MHSIALVVFLFIWNNGAPAVIQFPQEPYTHETWTKPFDDCRSEQEKIRDQVDHTACFWIGSRRHFSMTFHVSPATGFPTEEDFHMHGNDDGLTIIYPDGRIERWEWPQE